MRVHHSTTAPHQPADDSAASQAATDRREAAANAVAILAESLSPDRLTDFGRALDRAGYMFAPALRSALADQCITLSGKS